MIYYVNLFLILSIVLTLIYIFFKQTKILVKENFNKVINTQFNIDKIYVINLDKDTKRLSIFKNMCDTNNLSFERFPAINGHTLDPNNYYLKNYISPNNKLSNGQIGCALSHINIWHKVINSSNENVIIFEDDVIIPNNFINKLNIYTKELLHDSEMILLGGNTLIGKKYSKHFLHVNRKIKKNGNYGLFGYVIRKQTANKLLKTCKKINKTIDHYLNKKFYLKNKVFFCNPMLVKHNYNFYSNIFNKIRTDDSLRNNKIKII